MYIIYTTIKLQLYPDQCDSFLYISQLIIEFAVDVLYCGWCQLCIFIITAIFIIVTIAIL